MKTLILWQSEVLSGDGLSPKFFVLEGDYRKFDGIYINTYTGDMDKDNQKKYDRLQNQLTDLMYTEDGQYKQQFVSEPTKDWDFFIHCGFLP